MPRRRCCLTDTFDDGWALIEPPLPVPACDTRASGRPEKHPAEPASTPKLMRVRMQKPHAISPTLTALS